MAKDSKLDKALQNKTASAEVVTSNFDRIAMLSNDLNKSFGKNIVRTGDKIPFINKVPFREPMLDYVSDGGIPIGRFTELLGQEHSGKTRDALVSLGQFQKYCFNCNTPNALTVQWEINAKGVPYTKELSCSCCKSPRTAISSFVDIEGTTDPLFMSYFGIDVKGVMYLRPERPSMAIDFVDAFMRDPLVGLIIVDSVGAMSSDAEVDEKFTDNKMNKGAITLNKAIRKWQAALNTNTNSDVLSGTTLIVVNQSYSNIGLFSYEIAQGGRGLRHGKGMSLKTRIKEKMYDKQDNILGVHIEIKNDKNKTGMPYRKAEYFINLDSTNKDIAYCQSDIMLQYTELGLLFGLIQQNGGWYSFGSFKVQGKDKLVAEIKNVPEIIEAVDAVLYGNKQQ